MRRRSPGRRSAGRRTWNSNWRARRAGDNGCSFQSLRAHRAAESRKPRSHHRRQLAQPHGPLPRGGGAAADAGSRPRDALQLARPGHDRMALPGSLCRAPACCRSRPPRAAPCLPSRSSGTASAVDAIAAAKAALSADALELHVADARAFIARETRRFDVIFLDPPFHDDPWDWLLPACAERLEPRGYVYAEAGRAIRPPPGARRRGEATGPGKCIIIFSLHRGRVHNPVRRARGRGVRDPRRRPARTFDNRPPPCSPSSIPERSILSRAATRTSCVAQRSSSTR